MNTSPPKGKTEEFGPLAGKRMKAIEGEPADAALDFIERANRRLEQLQPLVFQKRAVYPPPLQALVAET